MTQKAIWQHFSGLPPEARQQVLDFIAFLQTRYTPSRPRKRVRPTKLAQEAFVGIWRNREDLHDSSAWVRNARTSEWGKP